MNHTLKKSTKIVVSGNIGSGKTSLCLFLRPKIQNCVYIEEKFQSLEKLPLYYEENKKNSNQGNKFNKFALDLQLEFLEQRYNNEKQCELYSNKVLLLDRCFHEDYFIFAKTQM